MALAGRKTVVKAATTQAGPYTVVAGIKQANVEMDGAQIDVSEFGVNWKETLRGMLDAKITLSGNYIPTDTNGQLVIRSAFINDTPLWLEVLPDGTTGFQMQTQVTKFGVDAGVDKEVSVTIDGSQTGGITFI